MSTFVTAIICMCFHFVPDCTNLKDGVTFVHPRGFVDPTMYLSFADTEKYYYNHRCEARGKLGCGPTFPVLCQRDVTTPETWLVIMRRYDGSVNFTRTSNHFRDDYYGGFGNFHHEFWLGLRRIYLLTQDRPQKLRIELTTENNHHYVMTYGVFWVEEEWQRYKLHVGKYTGNGSDAMSNMNGYVWVTHRSGANDHVTAGRADVCVNSHYSGWWIHPNFYKSCSRRFAYANLNGQYGLPCGRATHCISWPGISENQLITRIVMKIKPNEEGRV